MCIGIYNVRNDDLFSSRGFHSEGFYWRAVDLCSTKLQEFKSFKSSNQNIDGVHLIPKMMTNELSSHIIFANFPLLPTPSAYNIQRNLSSFKTTSKHNILRTNYI